MERVPGIIEYKIADTWLQLAEGEVSKTSWAFRIGVRNLSSEKNRLESLGIKTTEVDKVPGVISFFSFKDIDGNNLSFYELL